MLRRTSLGLALLLLAAASAGLGAAEIDETRAGRVGGASVTHEVVRAFSTDVYRAVFRGGEVAVISIVGDGDTDLDLYVYDAFDRLVTRGISYNDRETVSFVPPRTQQYRIEVRNLGRVWNRYTMTTN